MVIKLGKYFLSIFLISLFLIFSFYIYNIYYLNKPIYLNTFNQIINKNVENYFSKKVKSNLYKVDIEKSFIEINKFSSLLSINFFDVKITDKKQSIQSKLNEVKITFTAKDIFKNIFDKSEFFANTIKIASVDFNATLFEDKLKLGPLMFFLFNQFKKKSKIKIFNLDKSKIVFDKFNLNINDRANFFENNKLYLQCKSISASNLLDRNNNLSVNCKEKNYLDFNFNLLKASINKIDINGSINKLNPKIFNHKQFNVTKPILGNLIGNYNIKLTEGFLLKNIKFKIKDKSRIVFDNPFLKSKKVLLKGEMNWSRHDNTIHLQNIKLNQALLNGKIHFKDKTVLSNISFKLSELNLTEIKNFFNNKKKIQFFSKYKNQFEKYLILKDQSKIENIILNFSTLYNIKDRLFLIKQLDSIGKIKNLSFKNYPDEIKNLRSNFDGNFNFTSTTDNFKLKIDGFFKNPSFQFKQQKVNFQKIKVSTLINNSSIILEEILFYKNDVKTIFMKGKLWNEKNKLKIGKLNIDLDQISPNLMLKFINNFAKLDNLKKVKVKKGKLIKSKIFIKLTDDNGKKLNKNIVLAELNFKDFRLNVENLNSDLKIKTLIANFDKNTNLFGYVEGSFDKHQFNLNYQIDKNNKIKALGNLLPSKILENIVFDKTGFEIKSMSNVRIQLDGNLFEGFFKMHAYSDLKKSLIRNNVLNIYKPKNLNGYISGDFEFKNYKLINLYDLNFSYGLKNISCDVIYLLNNKLQIKDLKSHNFDLKKININKLDDKVLISASGNKINLSHLKKNLISKNFKNEKKIEFDLIAKQINLDKKLSISGNYRGYIKDNIISSVATGKMLLDKKEILDAGEIKINVKNKNYSLNGQGELGGANTIVQIVGSENKLPKVVFESDDGGKLLSALDFTNNIKSGRITLKIKYLDKELSKYTGLIDGNNFSIVNAPGIVRSLSSLSFSGINSLFVGQGVKFEDGVAVFLKTPNKMTFKKILINNETLNIFLNGTYNLNNKNIEFTGSIAPINIISKIISVVPAVGQLLTGINKKGIIAGQFKLTGNIKNPIVNLNEMSFAPGILREIFSRNWIKENSIKLENE